MKISVLGKGAMGKAMAAYLEQDELVEHVSRAKDLKASCQVLIDFSHRENMKDLLAFAQERQIPLVIGTTGLDQEDERAIQGASKDIPILVSENMSLGIAALRKLLKIACELLPGADIELIESHHRDKADAPSGTAKALAKEIRETRKELEPLYGRGQGLGKRSPNELGIHSIRGGTAFGDHTIIFAGEGEQLVLQHKAQSREIFVKGALKASLFLLDQQPGLYTFEEMLQSDYKKEAFS